MEKISDRIIEAVRQEALVTPGVKRYKLAAGLFERNKLIAVKGNSLKTHPLQLRHSPYPHLHAESHCIIHHGLDNCADYNLLVLRVLTSGRLTMSYPCDHCLNLIRHVGIANVYYSDWNGDIQCIQ